MILGYKVENIITALYFQCDGVISGKEKALYFHYIGLGLLLFFFFPLFTIAADLGSVERTLHPVCCKALQYREGFRGPSFLPGILIVGVNGHGTSWALFASWCRAVLKSHRTDQR